MKIMAALGCIMHGGVYCVLNFSEQFLTTKSTVSHSFYAFCRLTIFASNYTEWI